MALGCELYGTVITETTTTSSSIVGIDGGGMHNQEVWNTSSSGVQKLQSLGVITRQTVWLQLSDHVSTVYRPDLLHSHEHTASYIRLSHKGEHGSVGHCPGSATNERSSPTALESHEELNWSEAAAPSRQHQPYRCLLSSAFLATSCSSAPPRSGLRG